MNFLNEATVNFINGAEGRFSVPDDYDYSADFPFETDNFQKILLSCDYSVFLTLTNFLSGTKRLFALCGFPGEGKTQCAKLLKKCVRDDILYFNVTCFEHTNLDDILLEIYKQFIKFRDKKQIILPKVETNVFAEKINAYIKHSNKNILFIFDDADIKNKSEDITRFIKFISDFEKVKVIVTCRDFLNIPFKKDAFFDSAVLKTLTSGKYKKILEDNGFTASDELIEASFGDIRGHKLYVFMMLNLLKLLNISLENFFNDLVKSNKPFLEYIIRKTLSLIPERFFKVLWFLAIIRPGVSEKFLLSENIATQNEISYLKDRNLICVENDFVFIKDYIKKYVLENASSETIKDIHVYLENLYNSQLPKKPFERDISVSRNTMREESLYHQKNAEKIPLSKERKGTDISYLGYSKIIGSGKNLNLRTSVKKERKKLPPPPGNNIKATFASRARLTPEEEQILRAFASKKHPRPLMKTLKKNAPGEDLIKEKIEKKEDASTILVAAEEAFSDFNYEKAASLFNKALLFAQEDEHSEQLKPLLIEQIAVCKKKLQSNEEALKYFELASKLYYAANNLQKTAELIFERSEIYKETYNTKACEEEYLKILSFGDNISAKLRIEVLFLLSDLKLNSSDVKNAEYFALQALEFSQKENDKSLICESYFKCGLCFDDAGDVNTAFKYYIGCVKTSSEPEVNKFFSHASSNIAALYEEQNFSDKAVKFYEEAYKFDKLTQNTEGLLFDCFKIVEILSSKDTDKALTFALEAENCAKSASDYSALTEAQIKIGDLYYGKKSYELALKYYLLAKALLEEYPDPKNVIKIESRVEDMRKKFGNVIFDTIISEIQGE